MGLYNKIYLNIFIFNNCRKKKVKISINNNEEEPILNYDEKTNKQLITLTKFNTLVNSLMPTNIYDYLRITYSKIFGNEADKILGYNFPKRRHPFIKDTKKKVRFKLNFEEFESDV